MEWSGVHQGAAHNFNVNHNEVDWTKMRSHAVSLNEKFAKKQQKHAISVDCNKIRAKPAGV